MGGGLGYRNRIAAPPPAQGTRPILPRDWKLTLPKEGSGWADKAEFDELSRRSLTEHLTTIRCRGRLQPGEVAVLCVLRNEAARLPLFFAHYKKLGVDRFFMVDNNSDDGSHEMLLAEPLADVFHTTVPYFDSCFGTYWYNGLAREYCVGNWVLMADADELLVYDGMEAHGLRALGGWLEGQGFDRLFGIMLDIYPSGAVGQGGRTIAEVLDKDCWFDVEGYSARRIATGWIVHGGSRHRLFEKGATAAPISKYPFFRMTPETSLCNAHYVWPLDTRTNVAFGALLHLKLMDDFIRRSAVNEAEGQHWQGSLHYCSINRRLADAPDIVAVADRSRRYTGPESLIEHKIMSAIAWDSGERLDHARPYLAIGNIGWRFWRSSLPPPGKDWAQGAEFIALAERSLSEHLTPIRCRGALRVGEQGLICVLRDEIDRLPLFFEHYRSLGVTRFLMIDNGSSDGSHEFLLAQKDADVFLTHVPFRQGQAGLYWANGIARAFCIGHWILRVDADELLVYDGMEDHDLADLSRWLDAGGQDRLFAPLLDIYPSGPLAATQHGITEFLRHDCWFDPEGYELDRVRAGWNLTGGARRRLFGQKRTGPWPILSKYPFLRMTGETVIFSHHWQWPCDEVTEGPQGALLHFKLTDDLARRAERYAEQGQHFNGSEDYKAIAGQLAEHPDLTAFHEGSSRYRSPRSLVRQSFILPINWDEPTSPEEVEKRKHFLRPIPQPPERTKWVETLPDEGRVWEQRQAFNWQSHATLTEHMRIVRCRGPLAPGEIGLVCVVRNEADRLPLFFAHYKKLGVTRFFMVDNNSNDGSHAIISAEPMADIFLAHASYAEGLGGIYWVNGIAREFCRGCWMVHADIDELLVYDRVEERSLFQLGEWLEARNCDRLFALLIDVYPSGEIGRCDRSIAEILATDCWFDSDGYTEKRQKRGWLVTGGARHRLFNKGKDIHTHWLSKHPFIRMSEEMSIADAHFLWPVETEMPVARGALLHLKLMDDFRERSRRYAQEGQHAMSSRAYAIINEELTGMPRLVAHHAGSKRYEGPGSLMRHGLLQPIDWDA
ncbi:hypothetical protein G5V57_25150 [Nordella sp. HKS 07]|uniref:glycosyltransferase family 2 protein n=1 Tax=Nordella sp. HKS 07 TaxID=2712222 RepID=UPI0013E11FD1|nr:glycosyltransferase family 2 protein [Nordella sp. HKS 07]QIG50729.1 hypothetical protein G5V57_25150 [Nordella sp. HKS 07]